MTKKQKRLLGRPPRQENNKPTNEVILDISASLFLEKSYQDISMDEIAETANVTKATVYYYFSNKSQLYAEAMERMMARIRMRIRGMISQEKDLKENLRHVAAAHLAATFHLDLDAIIQNSRNVLHENDWKQMTSTMQLLEEEIAIIFQRARENGEIASHYTDAFCTQAFLALLKIGNKQDSHGNMIHDDPNAAAEEIVAFFCKGISYRD